MKEKDELKKIYNFEYLSLLTNDEDEFDDEYDDEYEDEFDDEYDEKTIFYQWSKKNDHLVRKGYNWENCFQKIKPIEYRSSNQIYKDKTGGSEHYEGFGYLTPVFNIISTDNIHDSLQKRSDEYIDALNLYNLSESGFATPSQISLIITIRDALLKQIKRQFKVIHSLNIEIKKVLKVYIYETTIGFRELNLSNLSREDIITHIRNANNVIDNIDFSFSLYINCGIKSNQVGLFIKESHYNPFVSKHLIEATNCGVSFFLGRRDSLIDVAVNLANKIYPLESIIEDSLLKGKLSSSKDYKKRILTRDDIVRKAHELKNNGMEVENMFNFIKKWLFEELGFSKSELKSRFRFEIKDHEDAHHSFNKFVNINKKHL